MVSSYQPLGDIPRAPQENSNYIQGYTDDIPPGLQSQLHGREGTGFIVSSRKLSSTLQRAGRVMGALEPVQNFNELEAQMHAWLDTRYAYLDETEYPTELILDAAHGGASTIKALLEVIPKVLAKADVVFDDMPEARNIQMSTYAKRSQQFILHWAGVHSETDVSLAQALDAQTLTGKPRRGNIFGGLHFAPEWFMADIDEQRIALDSLKIDLLRDRRGHKIITEKRIHAQKALVGCAGMHAIPRIYQMMEQRAAADGLYEQTLQQYLQEQPHESDDTNHAPEDI